MSDIEGHFTSTFTTGTITNTGATAAPENSYNICQRSGFRAKPGGLVREWTNLMVLPEFFEQRSQQDFIRAKAELLEGSKRPESDDTFITTAIDPAVDL